MSENIPLRVQFKRMTASEWARSDVILLESEIGFETDTGFARAGDGHNRFSDLGYISPLDYNLLTNKPNIDGLATKVETAQKLQQKADKETVYTKAESKQELDKKLNLKGGVMTGQLKFKPAATVAYSSSTGGAVNIDLSSSRGAGVVVYSNNDTSDGPLMSLRTGKETFNKSALLSITAVRLMPLILRCASQAHLIFPLRLILLAAMKMVVRCSYEGQKER